MVPLVVAGRPYMVLPVTGAERAGMTIGMDDPRLAEQLQSTALDAHPGETPGAIAYRVEADTRKRTPLRTRWARRFSGKNGSAPAIFDKRHSRLLSSKTLGRQQETGTDLSKPATVQQQLRSKVLEISVTAVLMAVGAATAYFSASEQGLNPLTWTLTGGGLGLFMAWVCLKWTRQ
jgi:hypothetical protein